MLEELKPEASKNGCMKAHFHCFPEAALVADMNYPVCYCYWQVGQVCIVRKLCLPIQIVVPKFDMIDKRMPEAVFDWQEECTQPCR